MVLDNKVMTKYGEGENPEINGFRTIIGNTWEAVGNNIWRIDLTGLQAIGYICSGTTELNNVGCFYEIEKEELHGENAPNIMN